MKLLIEKNERFYFMFSYSMGGFLKFNFILGWNSTRFISRSNSRVNRIFFVPGCISSRLHVNALWRSWWRIKSFIGLLTAGSSRKKSIFVKTSAISSSHVKISYSSLSLSSWSSPLKNFSSNSLTLLSLSFIRVFNFH